MSFGSDWKVHSQHGIYVWAEVVLLPIVALAVAVWFDPTTPFNTSSYPWLWLIPLLLGLRYGLAAAALSSLVLVGVGVGAYQLGWSGEQSPLIQLVGGTFAALGAGQYASRWRERLQANQTRTEYNEQRLESLTRAFFITRLSHNRLEEALITQPVTLRGAMEQMRALSAETPTGISAAGANALLQLLAQYCRFEAVALHLYIGDARLSDEPIATLGPSVALARTDPLLIAALEHEQTSYYSIDQLEQYHEDEYYRAVFPLTDATSQGVGMLVVRDLPLLALTEENLTEATVILQYFADESQAAAQTVGLRSHFPQCPLHFAHELIKLQWLQVRNDVRSTLIALRAPTTTLNSIYNIRRGLDLYWQSPFMSGQPGLLILLPLAGPASARGFLERIDGVLREQGLETGMSCSNFSVKQVQVDNRTPLELLRECGIESSA